MDTTVDNAVPLKLTRWQSGEPLDHEKLNKPVDAINRILGGVSIPRQVFNQANPSVSQLIIRQAKIVQIGADHFSCNPASLDAALGTFIADTKTTILVMKPWQLQRTPFNGTTYNGISYSVATGGASRVATQGVNTETQVVVPVYLPGDIVCIATGITGGAGAIPNGQGGMTLLDWIDLNVDARAWAKQ